MSFLAVGIIVVVFIALAIILWSTRGGLAKLWARWNREVETVEDVPKLRPIYFVEGWPESLINSEDLEEVWHYSKMVSWTEYDYPERRYIIFYRHKKTGGFYRWYTRDRDVMSAVTKGDMMLEVRENVSPEEYRKIFDVDFIGEDGSNGRY